MSEEQTDPDLFEAPTRQPLSVIVQREAVENMKWVSERWKVIGVVPGERANGQLQKTEILRDGTTQQFLWTGFSVELFKDDAESYYFNLVGDHPCVFVVCRKDEESGSQEPEPFLTTLSYDEAASYQEVEDDVFSVPIPPAYFDWIEHFVVANYFPEKRKKRQRKNWKEAQEP